MIIWYLPPIKGTRNSYWWGCHLISDIRYIFKCIDSKGWWISIFSRVIRYFCSDKFNENHFFPPKPSNHRTSPGLMFHFMPHGLGHQLGLDVHDVGGYAPGHFRKDSWVVRKEDHPSSRSWSQLGGQQRITMVVTHLRVLGWFSKWDVGWYGMMTEGGIRYMLN